MSNPTHDEASLSGKVANFALVCMARETPEVLRHFNAQYFGLGAAEIFIIYDGAESPELASLGAHLG